MIIFSQGPTLHNRLGNSITWYKEIYPILSDNGIKFYFPFARERQLEYLGPKSVWVQNFEISHYLFEKAFRKKLSSSSVASESRMIEDRYERQNNLRAFQWKSLIDYCNLREVLYITGEVDFNDKNLLERIKKCNLTICHEPFNFNFSNSIKTQDFIKKSYSSIKPNIGLINKCKQLLGRQIKKGNKRIAVHIREGDYKQWSDGRYIYSESFWTSLINKLIQQNNNIPVYVFHYGTNPLIIEKLKKLNIIILDEANPNEDLVKMMLMDEVWGPASTYSYVASDIAQNCLNRKVKLINIPESGDSNIFLSKI